MSGRGLWRHPPAPIVRRAIMPVDGIDPALPCYHEEVLADSPSAYWRHNEASGGATLADFIGSLDGSWSGAAHTSTTGATDAGDGDTALKHIRGSGDVLTVPDNAIWDRGNGPFTLEFWFRQDGTPATDFNEIFFKGSQLVVYKGTSNIIRTDNDATDGPVSNTVIAADGLYHHCAIVKPTSGADSLIIYVDGVDDTDTPVVQTYSNNATVATIGGRSGVIFDGALDEVAWYPTALSAGRVATHFAARNIVCGGGGGFDPALFAGAYQTAEPTDWIPVA